MSKRFFTEFEPTSTEAWEKVLEKELKGASYAEKLLWDSPEGFQISPYYRAGSAADKNATAIFYEPLSKEANWLAWAAFSYKGDIKQLESYAETAFDGGMHSLVVACSAAEYARIQADCQRYDLLERMQFQLLSPLTEDAYAPTVRCDSHSNQAAIPGVGSTTGGSATAESLANSSETGLIFTDTSLYKNAGLTITEEMAWGLASLHDHLLQATKNSSGPANNGQPVWLSLKMATGPNFFFELAKLRAMRILVANLLQPYGLAENYSLELIATETSWNKSKLDPHNNLLRSSSAAMASTAGGCDVLMCLPFDTALPTQSENAFRLANNTNLLLWHEGHFDKVSDPGAGSWYIEELTNKLIDSAWEVFQAIEVKGGFQAMLNSGEVQQHMAERKQELAVKIASGEIVLVGVNKYVAKNG